MRLGESEVKVIHTPGHTEDSVCYYDGSHLFTGDTLFIEAWGRTDLPGGSDAKLYSSLHEVIMALPETRSSTRATTTGRSRSGRWARRRGRTRRCARRRWPSSGASRRTRAGYPNHFSSVSVFELSSPTTLLIAASTRSAEKECSSTRNALSASGLSSPHEGAHAGLRGRVHEEVSYRLVFDLRDLLLQRLDLVDRVVRLEELHPLDGAYPLEPVGVEVSPHEDAEVDELLPRHLQAPSGSPGG